jgi:hypothetical protein
MAPTPDVIGFTIIFRRVLAFFYFPGLYGPGGNGLGGNVDGRGSDRTLAQKIPPRERFKLFALDRI